MLRLSSDVTKLMATPLRPNRPPRPILWKKSQSNMMGVASGRIFGLHHGMEQDPKLLIDAAVDALR